jgi:hypothetical protein
MSVHICLWNRLRSKEKDKFSRMILLNLVRSSQMGKLRCKYFQEDKSNKEEDSFADTCA